MKPKLNSIFPIFANSEIGEISVESVKINKKHRSMEIILDADLSYDKLDKLEDFIKQKYNLTSLRIRKFGQTLLNMTKTLKMK